MCSRAKAISAARTQFAEQAHLPGVEERRLLGEEREDARALARHDERQEGYRAVATFGGFAREHDACIGADIVDDDRCALDDCLAGEVAAAGAGVLHADRNAAHEFGVDAEPRHRAHVRGGAVDHADPGHVKPARLHRDTAWRGPQVEGV
jgi:hypothetical protein